jgi:hypothetical protein
LRGFGYRLLQKAQCVPTLDGEPDRAW